jgi:hypothetical protein
MATATVRTDVGKGGRGCKGKGVRAVARAARAERARAMVMARAARARARARAARAVRAARGKGGKGKGCKGKGNKDGKGGKGGKGKGQGQGGTRDEGTTKKSMILSVPFGHVIKLTAAATKKTTIGNTDNCQLTTLVNSASTAPPIGLPQKGAKFCHTLNILLVGLDATVTYGAVI